MMRTLIFAIALLALGAQSAADAQQRSQPPSANREKLVEYGPLLDLRLPPIKLRPHPTDRYRPLGSELYSPDRDDPLKATTVDLGPFSARLGGAGKSANLARYRLDGTDLFGGSLSGTVDTRGALVYWRWPPDQDNP